MPLLAPLSKSQWKRRISELGQSKECPASEEMTSSSGKRGKTVEVNKVYTVQDNQRDHIMTPKKIMDMPAEVLQTHIFRYLDDIDIYNLGMAGNQSLKEISTDYVQLGKHLEVLYSMLN